MPSTMQQERIKWELRQSMGEELMASSVYHTRMISALESGDSVTAELYEHIAKEEDSHFHEFTHRLQTLTGHVGREINDFTSGMTGR